MIEVALPLDAINAASEHEKDIHTGHPANIHSWWAGRPLAACRAVLFAQLVDDPGNDLPEDEAAIERERLFRIIRSLVRWENNKNGELFSEARREILKSSGGVLPVIADPFCGRGSIPLEAQRLGMPSAASDLNPVAVTISRALVELPAKFAQQQPINPNVQKTLVSVGEGAGVEGMKEDIQFYAGWMRSEVEKKIKYLYPEFSLPKSHGGGTATVIAWLWTRTAVCPNPACGAVMPLLSSLWLSKKSGEEAWLEPIVDEHKRQVSFGVRTGDGVPPPGPKVGRGASFRCLVCNEIASDKAIKAAPVGDKMTAVHVVDGNGRRWYFPASAQMELLAESEKPNWRPTGPIPTRLSGGTCVPYGMTEWGDLFNNRQLVVMNSFCDLIPQVRERLKQDGADDAYASAIVTYLALAVDRLAQTNCKLVRWLVRASGPSKGTPILDKQALPMVWDFAEGNVFGGSVGSWEMAVKNMLSAFSAMAPAERATVRQLNAAEVFPFDKVVFCTDPPYYGNISYAELSDFYYVWLRRSLAKVWPETFATMEAPKSQEMVAAPYRENFDAERAKKFFEEAIGKAFQRMHASQHRDYPLTIFYAFKQSESESSVDEVGIASTGWETMLQALIHAEFSITGTWPIRTERAARGVAIGSNALASSIVLVCRPRPINAATVSRAEFLRFLRSELPDALRRLQRENTAPVDLAQAAIGPGMAVFSRYARVLDAEGRPVTVREALTLINATLDQVLAEQEGDFDADSRWALAWFEQQGFAEGEYGIAETLSKAKNTSVVGLVEAGILESKRGKVRLLKPDELPPDWDPATDSRLTCWETVHHLIRVLGSGGESAAADLAVKLGARAEAARELAYRLYTICERKKRAAEALAYNGLVQSWPEIARLAQEGRKPTAQKRDLFNVGER